MRSLQHRWPDFSPIRGKHVLIALSGGADSVALTCMLAEATPMLGLRLTAAHFDHGIRAESAEDAQWCRRLCARLGIPFHTARRDVPAEAARRGEGLETTARRLRHAWLRQIQTEVCADYIALAHHMDDQAETVLMHLARGTGPEGIGGMAEFSGDLYRPLLNVCKRELMAWLTERNIDWREDSTNAVDDNPRNALRLHGIPSLEKSYPQFVPAVARYASAARLESDYLAEQTEVWLSDRLIEGPYGRALRLSPLPHPALLHRAIRRLCGADLNYDTLSEIAELCASPRGKVTVSGSLSVERTGDRLYFLPNALPPIPEAPLDLNGVTPLASICELRAEAASAVPVRDDPQVQVLDKAALEGAVLRTRHAGDRFRPLGCGDRLLSDYFTDRKLDRPLRDVTALVAQGSRVLWVCGMGISEEARLKGDSAPALRLSCRYLYDR